VQPWCRWSVARGNKVIEKRWTGVLSAEKGSASAGRYNNSGGQGGAEGSEGWGGIDNPLKKGKTLQELARVPCRGKRRRVLVGGLLTRRGGVIFTKGKGDGR